jgi:hypothetical protein
VLTACSNAASPSSTTHGSSLSTGPAAQKYIDLANGFWDDHVTATAGAELVCLGSGVGTHGINPALCKQHGDAMLAVQDKFLAALAPITPPPQFATEDKTFRSQLAIASGDLKTMLAACDAADLQAIQNAANTYVADMGPILDALNVITPAVDHV